MIRFVTGLFMVIFGVAGIEGDAGVIGFGLCLAGITAMAWGVLGMARKNWMLWSEQITRMHAWCKASANFSFKGESSKFMTT